MRNSRGTERRVADDTRTRFFAELRAIKREIDAARGPEDVSHLKRIEIWGKVATIVGFATAWLVINPISIFLLSQGRLTRWVIAHHIMHKAYDRIPNVPARFTSKVFAKGPFRRFIDWFDWIDPEAWDLEHNRLHHPNLLGPQDPSWVEGSGNALPIPFWRRPLKFLLLLNIFSHWRATVYVLTSMKQLFRRRSQQTPIGAILDARRDISLLSPFNEAGREVWWRCLLPYGLVQFVLIPALFLLVSREAAINVVISSILAEIVGNIHSGITIYPNHAGDDLYRLESATSDPDEVVLQNIVGTTNFRTGGTVNDLMHLWLNYHIEHHVWPTLTMRQYQLVQPKLKALCDRYGIPYVQQSVWQRVRQSFRVFTGTAPMPVADASTFFSMSERPPLEQEVTGAPQAARI